jgi:glycosyltransferase involved in cell wall biosynthesis
VVEPLQSQAQGDALPLVTVAMPIYNAGKYLRLAVFSIVKQTFQNWELLIIDDGSIDNALQDIADINDTRIRILRDGANRGLAARLNEAIDLARGQYLARMDQDDVSYPERFARQIEALQNDSKLDLVSARAITIDENNEESGLFPYPLSHDEICARPWLGFYLPHPIWMGRIEWFRKHRYSVPGPYFCEDQELLLRSYSESKFGTVNEILFGYRIRGKVNWKKLAKTRRTVLSIQLRYFMEAHQWHFVLLATATFVGRMSSDLLRRMRGSISQPVCDIVDNTIVFEWHKILDDLATKLKAP